MARIQQPLCDAGPGRMQQNRCQQPTAAAPWRKIGHGCRRRGTAAGGQAAKVQSTAARKELRCHDVASSGVELDRRRLDRTRATDAATATDPHPSTCPACGNHPDARLPRSASRTRLPLLPHPHARLRLTVPSPPRCSAAQPDRSTAADGGDPNEQQQQRLGRGGRRRPGMGEGDCPGTHCQP